MQPQMELGESCTQVARRSRSLECRFLANLEVYESCSAFKEFMDWVHLEGIESYQIDQPSSEVYFLPQHCVFTENSTTKMRVVLGRSANTNDSRSLNESLMVGAKVQPELYSTLFWFRFH